MIRQICLFSILISVPSVSFASQDCKSTLKGMIVEKVPSSKTVSYDVSVNGGKFYKCNLNARYAGDTTYICGDQKIRLNEFGSKHQLRDIVFDKNGIEYQVGKEKGDVISTCKKISEGGYKQTTITTKSGEIFGYDSTNNFVFTGIGYVRRITGSLNFQTRSSSV